MCACISYRVLSAGCGTMVFEILCKAEIPVITHTELLTVYKITKNNICKKYIELKKRCMSWPIEGLQKAIADLEKNVEKLINGSKD